MSALSPQVCVQAETRRFVRLGHRRLPLTAVNGMKWMKHAHNRTEDTKETQQEKPHVDVRSETSRDGRHEWNELSVNESGCLCLGNIVILERRTPARVH